MSKISQLTAASSLTGAESLPIVQSGNSRKVPVSNILTDSLFTPAGTGAVAESLQTFLFRTVYVTQFMSPAQKADVSAGTLLVDISAAVRAAIASLPNGGEILWPPGGYLMNSQAVQSTTYPNGLRHRALASSSERNATGGGPVLLKYTGTGVCWDIQNALGTTQTGGWEWGGFNFEATQGAAGMFRFNNTAVPPTGDATTQNFITQVSFKSCHFKGADAGASQTGNAIEGTKVFEMHIDEHCVIERWKRGTWLFGCDNITLAARYIYNTRNIQIDRSGIFGNNTKITSRYCGTPSGSAESRYMMYLNGDAKVSSPFVETVTAGDTAFYFGSYNITIKDPIFSMSAGYMMEVGAGARDVNMIRPVYTGTGAVVWNTIATPTSADFGGIANYTVTIHDPIDKFVNALTPHPRIRVLPKPVGEIHSLPRFGLDNLPYATGSLRIARKTCSSFGYWGQTSGTDLGTIPNPMTVDAGAPFGYAIQLPATNLAGFYCFFGTIGKGIENGDIVNIRVYYKMSGVPAAGDYRILVAKNGNNVSQTVLAVSAVYAVQNVVYTLAGYAAGDSVAFGVFNNAVTDKTLNIADISMAITQAAVVDTTGATLPNVEIEVNKLKAALRIAGVISF